ncbi:DUF805 domain-containing protein [Deinococcus ficus]|uniref:DUF805 domain-containing protein n=1 Tax=Deinococcus ficus TaxID=317577 RepID=A0A221SXP7_9DEIO|nr:DUF805 domain-containing protein [Deinococcus ficus]ASN81413.1 DUF805 domain-containing protein [Deinococcus ficus]GHF86669.1 DUF805 domain-containing protein [Deinococcus ficus]
MQDYLNVIKNHYADFKGRARRREYWMFTLINAIITFVLQIPAQGALMGMAMQSDASGAPSAGLTGIALISSILLLVYTLAVLLPSIGVAVRRMHDTGRSGWLLLLGLIPFIGWLILLYFYVQDSQPGANKWGPNPKGQGTNVPQNAATNW